MKALFNIAILVLLLSQTLCFLRTPVTNFNHLGKTEDTGLSTDNWVKDSVAELKNDGGFYRGDDFGIVKALVRDHEDVRNIMNYPEDEGDKQTKMNFQVINYENYKEYSEFLSKFTGDDKQAAAPRTLDYMNSLTLDSELGWKSGWGYGSVIHQHDGQFYYGQNWMKHNHTTKQMICVATYIDSPIHFDTDLKTFTNISGHTWYVGPKDHDLQRIDAGFSTISPVNPRTLGDSQRIHFTGYYISGSVFARIQARL